MRNESNQPGNAVILAVNGSQKPCRGCQRLLSGRQTDWCSDRCKNQHNKEARQFGEEMWEILDESRDLYLFGKKMKPQDRLKELVKAAVRIKLTP